MNGQKDGLLKNIVSLLGVASVSALLTFPVLAQLGGNKSNQGNGQMSAQNSGTNGSSMNRSSNGNSMNASTGSSMNGSPNGSSMNAPTGADNTNGMMGSSTMKQKQYKGAYSSRQKSGYKSYRQAQRADSVRALW